MNPRDFRGSKRDTVLDVPRWLAVAVVVFFFAALLAVSLAAPVGR